MSTIIFRKYRAYSPVIDLWLYGSLIYETKDTIAYFGSNFNPWDRYHQKVESYSIMDEHGERHFFIDYGTISQSTGRLDRNKNEIYDGDYVRVKGKDEIYLVMYHEHGCYFYLKGGWLKEELNSLEDDDLEVISNLWDNLR
jgi:hypothetical protein